MSWFIKLLKCILCFEDEEREISRNSGQYEYQRLQSADSYSRTTLTQSPLRSQSQYEYQRLPSADSYSRTSLTQSPLRSQSNLANTTTSSKIAKKLLDNSVNLPSTPKRESIQRNSVSSRNVVVKSCATATDPCNKVPVVSSQFAVPSSVKPPSAATKVNPSLISEKSGDVITKANYIVSSSLSADVLQTKVNGVTKQSTSNNVTSASSQRSQPSSELPSYVHSFKPPSVTTKPTPSSVSEKSKPNPSSVSTQSSQHAWKPKEPFPSSDDNVCKSSTMNRATNKGTDYQLRSDVCSSLSKPLQSSAKLPLSPGSAKLLSPVSDTEKRSPNLKKDQQPSPLPALPQSPKPAPLSTKPTLSPLRSSSTSQQEKTNYVWVEKSASTTYVFPEDIKSLIEKDIVPGVLKMPLSLSTYKDYFHALLYAEDCHLEKWEGFEIKNVILKFHDARIYTRKGNSKSYNHAVDKDEKVFLEFDIDKVLERQPTFDRKCERRPFLLSRDFISVKPTGRKIKPFQGVIYRVVKSSLVLAEFEESFLSQRDPECEYDVNFSFNRVCLKRAHHAIIAAPEVLYRNFLFPDFALNQELPCTELFVNYGNQKDAFAVRQILRLQGAPPYLVEGPMSVVERSYSSRTGKVIVEAVLQICRSSPSNRVLLCAPSNNTCDVLMRGLKKGMEESEMFRANAAFREFDGVPEDILPSCLYEEEVDCFACPSLEELKKYKVISSTFMSSFRLRDEGMVVGHFSHIFLVDASSATEPETMVPLANFVNSKTVVVVTGTPRNRTVWVRSMIARQNGLRISYFERLRASELYWNLDPRVITQLEDIPQTLNESSKSLSPFWI